jgi:hypothetical protein
MRAMARVEGSDGPTGAPGLLWGGLGEFFLLHFFLALSNVALIYS